jgi:Protein kinase domain
MGVVYLAEQLSLGRPVALKVITPDLAGDVQFRTRFEREARVAARLDHPNVVPVFSAGEEEGRLYIAMRYVEGTDLRALLRERGRLHADEAAEIVAQIGAALDAAHGRGLVHRDVKPGNVLLARDGEGGFHAYLTDFGITKDAVAQSAALTNTGDLVGTVDYVSPEQLSGAPIDARSDIYSLGCVLFEALTGHPPYGGANVQKLYAHVHEPPPTLQAEAPMLAPLFDPVVSRAMAKDPDARYPSAGDCGRAARSAARGEQNPIPERTVAAGEAASGITPATAPVADAATSAPAAPRPTAPIPAAPTPAPVATAPATVPPSRSGGGLRTALIAVGATLLVIAVAALAVVALRGGDEGASSSMEASKTTGGGGGTTSKQQAQDKAFLADVDDLLKESQPSYDKVNDVFQRMQQVADGDVGAITPAEARSQLSSIVANRTSLRQAAIDLDAKNALGREVKEDLAEAFGASLQNDREIENCIEAGTASGPGELFSDCLSSTASSSQSATEAKDRFRDSYNRLRARLGLGKANPTF